MSDVSVGHIVYIVMVLVLPLIATLVIERKDRKVKKN